MTSASLVGRCYLCDRTSDQVVWHENGIDGKLCPECGLLYADTGGRTVEQLGEFKDPHPEPSFYAMPARYKARWMAARAPKGRLLEVGCGDSSFLAAARDLGYDIAGMEPRADCASRVSNELGIAVERAIIEADTLPPAIFDVVFHCDLLAHFPDPPRALASMVRLLRPGGVLCFEVGILGGLTPFWYRVVGEIDLGPHLFLYSFPAFINLMERAGLEVKHRTDFGLAPQTLLHRPLSIFSRHVVRPILGPVIAKRFQYRCETTLRYPIGRVSPLVGPATVMIVAQPVVRG